MKSNKTCFCNGNKTFSPICSECYNKNIQVEENILNIRKTITSIKRILNKKYILKGKKKHYWNENNTYKNLTWSQYNGKLERNYSKLDGYLECRELFMGLSDTKSNTIKESKK